MEQKENAGGVASGAGYSGAKAQGSGGSGVEQSAPSGRFEREVKRRNHDGYYPLSDEQTTDLANRFAHHPPIGNQLELYDRVRTRLREAAADVLSCMPPGREQSLFLTNMEQAMFWANSGIAREPASNYNAIGVSNR